MCQVGEEWGGMPQAADVILEAALGSGRGRGGGGWEVLTRQGAVEAYGYMMDMPGGLAFQTLEKVALFCHGVQWRSIGCV